MRTTSMIASALLFACLVVAQEPLDVSPLWKSEAFRKAYTNAYRIDSKIEPLINEDEAFYLNEAAKLMEEGNRTGAIEKLNDSDLVEKSPALLFSMGNFHFEENKIDEAVGYFAKALELFPNFRDAHRNLAIVQIQKEEFDAAEQHLKRAVELGSQDGLTFGLLAWCHTNKERFQAALSAYRMAQITMPEEEQWRLGEASSLLTLGEPAKAAAIYRSLLEQHPEDAGLWINQAHAYSQDNDYESAIVHLELAGRIAKLSPENHIILGQMYAQQAIPSLALKNYKAAIQNRGVSLTKAVKAFQILVHYRFWNEAGSFGEQCAKTYGSELSKGEGVAFHRIMALVELETGQTAAGAKRVEKLIEEYPLDGDALLLLARFRETENKPEEAMMLLEQAALIPDHRAAALLAQGRILVNQFDYGKALKLLEESQQLKPNESLKNYIEAIGQLGAASE